MEIYGVKSNKQTHIKFFSFLFPDGVFFANEKEKKK